MKIVALLGSPRLNGNSAFLANRFLETAKDRGADVRSFALNTLAYRGCQACRGCKKTADTCILKDDLTAVLDAVRDADIAVFATPVYFGDISGQLKLFIDRTYCYLTPDFYTNPHGSRLSPGKQAVLILTQGMADETAFADVATRYEWILKLIGFATVHIFRGCNLAKPDDVQNQERLVKQVEALAAEAVTPAEKQ